MSAPTPDLRAAITGIGISAVGRRLGRDPWSLTAEAALAAIADAGLTPRDIDGLSTYPGGTFPVPGFTGAGAWDVRNMLGLELRWINGGPEVAGQIGSVINAAIAVSAGIANHVLCFRSVWETTAQDQIGRAAALLGPAGRPIVTGDREFTVPFGVGNACHGALLAQRYFHQHGASREQLAQVALVARANAGLNSAAVYRTPLSMDDYLGARIISAPLCLYDCDVPVDGCIAVVVSRREAAADTAKRPIEVAAVGSAPGLEPSAAMLWSMTDLKPDDVDIAEVYDGWSILTLLWLEALGLCGRGEAASFVEGGSRIARSGDLPVNTGGGQLSAGRLHGYVQVHEACVQLRGEGGSRQVAPHPEVAVVSTGANHFAGCLLLAAAR
jgi:acetyl-CoA acetyltransferase